MIPEKEYLVNLKSIGVSAIALLLGSCAADRSADEEAILMVMADVAGKLDEPEATDFRGVRMVDGLVCGEVRETTKPGGYQRFSGRYSPSTGELRSAILDDRIGPLVKLYEKNCADSEWPKDQSAQIELMEEKLDAAKAQ